MPEVKKIKTLNIAETMKRLGAGEYVTFKVAGEHRDCTSNNLFMLKKRHNLNCEIVLLNGGTIAKVTGL